MGLTPSFRLPNFIPAGAAHESVRSSIQSHDNSITDLNQAVVSLKGQITDITSSAAASSGTSTSTTTSTESITNVTNISGGVVNNQTGVVSYMLASGDNGALLIFSDTNPVAVTLNNSLTLPFYCFVTNQGAGIVTLTPQQNTIDGNANQTLLQGYFLTLFFDGSDWWSGTIPIVPLTFSPVAHEFLTGYDQTSGDFSAAQPAFTDVSGIAATSQIGTGTPSAGKYVDGAAGAWTALPTVPATKAPVAGEYLTGYNATTGAFSQSSPAGLSVTITTAALTLTGTQGSMTYIGGVLTAQVQAT